MLLVFLKGLACLDGRHCSKQRDEDAPHVHTSL